MNLLKELKREKKNLFQFYIITGDSEKNKKIISDFLEKELKINLHKNLFSLSGEKFLIDLTRDLKKENSISVGESEKRIIFLDFKKIEMEGQNALLKTFEEVAENTNIFLFVSSDNFLLPTIKSRGRILDGEKKYDLKLAEKFIQGSFLEREKIIEKIERDDVPIFLDSIEIILLKNKNINKEFYKNFLELKKYSFNKGVSMKNILTWIAMNLE